MKLFILWLAAAAAWPQTAHQHDAPRTAQGYARSLEDPKREAWQKPDQVVMALELKASDAVADIGAGTGYFSRRFAKHAAKVYAVDVDAGLLEMAKRDAPPNLETILAAPDDPKLPENSVDVIFFCNVLHHIENRPSYYPKLAKALKSGGRIVNIDFYKKPLPVGPPVSAKLTEEEVIGEFEAAGFAKTQSFDFLPYQYFLVFQRKPPVAILPQPVKLELQTGEFTLKRDTVILAGGEARPAGAFLAQALAPSTGFRLAMRGGGAGRPNTIRISIDASLSRLGEEGYTLDVTPERVEIRAPKPAGAFYGVQSLRQLLPPAVYASSVRRDAAWRIPCVRIEDYPRFPWRGALIDVARHFMPKQTILKFIDLIAMLKMNSLQLHLTDDQGWRIEIKKYPLLTEVGSKRKETRLGHERRSKEFDGTPHGGFYSQADIREIVAYARERHVNVLPEIEMPGHAQAAIASYPELGNTGEKLEVLTQWGVNKNVFNVNEKTILFLQDVLGEVIELFPSRFIHVGGDEVPLDQWKASSQAQARMKELGLAETVQLHGYFIRRMDQFLRKRGRRLVGWDEILEGGVDPSATVMSWRGNKGGIKAAQAGHDVVMAPNTHTYFDYYQSKDPGEPLAIGGFLPLERVYSFEPVPPELSAEEAKRILGTQGQLWTEYIATPEHLEYMAFPRLAALAEVAWLPAAQKDYGSFLGRLRVQEERWKVIGVNFRAHSSSR